MYGQEESNYETSLDDNTQFIYIAIGLIIFIAIAIGLYFYFKKCKGIDDVCEEDDDCCEKLTCMSGTCLSPLLCAESNSSGKYTCPEGKQFTNSPVIIEDQQSFNSNCCRSIICSDFKMEDCSNIGKSLNISGQGNTLDECCIDQLSGNDGIITTGSYLPCEKPPLNQINFLDKYYNSNNLPDGAVFNKWPDKSISASMCIIPEIQKIISNPQQDESTRIKYDEYNSFLQNLITLNPQNNTIDVREAGERYLNNSVYDEGLSTVLYNRNIDNGQKEIVLEDWRDKCCNL